jgi:hypothetical protein
MCPKITARAPGSKPKKAYSSQLTADSQTGLAVSRSVLLRHPGLPTNCGLYYSVDNSSCSAMNFAAI